MEKAIKQKEASLKIAFGSSPIKNPLSIKANFTLESYRSSSLPPFLSSNKEVSNGKLYLSLTSDTSPHPGVSPIEFSTVYEKNLFKVSSSHQPESSSFVIEPINSELFDMERASIFLRKLIEDSTKKSEHSQRASLDFSLESSGDFARMKKDSDENQIPFLSVLLGSSVLSVKVTDSGVVLDALKKVLDKKIGKLEIVNLLFKDLQGIKAELNYSSFDEMPENHKKDFFKVFELFMASEQIFKGINQSKHLKSEMEKISRMPGAKIDGYMQLEEGASLRIEVRNIERLIEFLFPAKTA